MTHGEFPDIYREQPRQAADRNLIIAPGPEGGEDEDVEGGSRFDGRPDLDGSFGLEGHFGFDDGFGAQGGFRDGYGYADEGPSARDRLATEWGEYTGFFPPQPHRPALDTDSVMIAATGVAQALQAGDLDTASKLALQVDPRSIREAKFELFGVLADASPEKRQSLLRLSDDLKMLQRASFAFELIENGDDREGMFLLHQLLGPEAGTGSDPRTGPMQTDTSTGIPFIGPSGSEAGTEPVPLPQGDPTIPAPSDTIPAPSDPIPAPSDTIPAPGDTIPAPGDTIPAPSDTIPAPGDTTGGQESPYIIVPTDPPSGTDVQPQPGTQPGTNPDTQPGTQPDTQPSDQPGLSPAVREMIYPAQ